MEFAVSVEKITSEGAEIEAYLVPWDSEILGIRTAELSTLQFADAAAGRRVLQEFGRWMARNGVVFCASRLAHGRMDASLLLQSCGFDVIELTYRPEIRHTDGFVPCPGITVRAAANDDREVLVAMAGEVFEAGRFHADPRLGPAIAAKRYAIWMDNAFERDTQEVLVCEADGRIVGFFVTEAPAEDARFWSLVGLAPGLQGRGMGRKVWQTMLAHHHGEGIATVSTSISSHNTAVMNLYVSLGFRFPAPSVAYHLWND